MKSPSHHPRPPGKLAASAILALIPSWAGFFLFVVLVTQNNDDGSLRTMGLFVSLILGCIAFPIPLVKQHWRRVHGMVFLAWLPNLWITLSLLIFLLLILTNLLSSIDISISIFFWGIVPALCMALFYAVRKLRSEQILLVAMAVPLTTLFTEAAVFWRFNFEPWRAFSINEFGWFLIAFFMLLQITPVFIALFYLAKCRLWGSRPSKSMFCLMCDYDLTGTLQAGQSACPECGIAIPLPQKNHFTATSR